MIVTEEMLRPYRGEKPNPVRLAYSKIPIDWFTPSDELLEQQWTAFGDEPEKLCVVPMIAFTDWVPPLHCDYEWHAICHQSGGYLCGQVRMFATRLTPKPQIAPHLNAIGRQMYFKNDGWFSRSYVLASELVAYVAALAEINLDCEHSWRLLEESVYPIDLRQRNLEIVAERPPQVTHFQIMSALNAVRQFYSSLRIAIRLG